MALVKGDFNLIGAQSQGPAIYNYVTADAIATVEGAGYFNGVADLVKSPGIIFVIASDATKVKKVTKAGSVVTVSAGTAIT